MPPILARIVAARRAQQAAAAATASTDAPIGGMVYSMVLGYCIFADLLKVLILFAIVFSFAGGVGELVSIASGNFFQIFTKLFTGVAGIVGSIALSAFFVFIGTIFNPLTSAILGTYMAMSGAYGPKGIGCTGMLIGGLLFLFQSIPIIGNMLPIASLQLILTIKRVNASRRLRK